jgi:PKD repeat protein
MASFAASPMTGAAPLVVTLTDKSTGVASRSWSLGDGTTATTQTVVKTYSKPGIYTVTLTIRNSSGGSDKAILWIYVAAPVAGSPPPATGGSGGTGTSSGGSGTTTGGSDTPTGGSTSTKVIAPHTSGLVAAYGFEETTGSMVIDASGNANHGQILGATRLRTTWFGRALQFDGRDDWVTIEHSASLGLAKAMTLEAWVFPTARLSGSPTVLLKERSGGLAYALDANSDAMAKPSSTINAGGADRQLAAGPQLPVNTWTHLAATYDGSTQRLYVNGQLAGSRPQAGTIVASDGKLRIGGSSIANDEHFTGYVDEVRVYNRALTQSEIVGDSRTAVVGLVVSTSVDRSNPLPLNGLALSGTVYIHYAHVNPKAAARVAFWLDDPTPARPSGAPLRLELRNPFDFAGTGDNFRPVGFDTSRLSKGIHRVTAQVTMSDGTVLPFVQGTFTIK